MPPRLLGGYSLKLHQEMKFPLQAPIGACFASGYYWSYPEMNVIYVPLAESDMLLHLPDLAHEMAHILIHFAQDARVEALRKHYEQCRQIVNQYYVQRMLNRRTAGGPAGYLRYENNFRQQWLDKWLLEIVYDLFAVFVLGPSFVWAHSHLVGKMSDNAYLFSHDNITTHSADEARMKAMLIGLGLLGFDQESKAIDIQWKKVVQVLGHQKDPDYHLAYPDDLIESIAVEIFRGTIELGCNIMTAAKLVQNDSNSMTALLNNAWTTFWKNPGLYSAWEQKTVQSLKGKIIPD